MEKREEFSEEGEEKGMVGGRKCLREEETTEREREKRRHEGGRERRYVQDAKPDSDCCGY